MEFEKKTFNVYSQGDIIMDQFYLDEDFNVPDMKRDVKRIVMSEGKLQIEEMKQMENHIRVSGKIPFKILYVTDEGETKLASLEGRISFEEMLYTKMPPLENLFLKTSQIELSATIIHSRKLNLKMIVELELCSDGKREEELLMDFVGEGDLYKQYSETEILELFTIKKDTYRVKEEVTIGGTKETIGSILWSEVVCRRLDTRLSQDEILLQGELLFFGLYESIDGKTDWITQTIPYQGKVNCYGVNDHMFHQIYPEINDVLVDVRMDEDGEMRILGVEATLEFRIIVYEEERIRILDDMYSLEKKCELEREQRSVERLLMQNHLKCKVIERLSLPEIKDNILQICHSSARIKIENTEIKEKGMQVDGILHVNFLYIKPDDIVPFDVWQGMVPFTCFLESNETCPDMISDLSGMVEQLSIGLLGNEEVEVKAVIAFQSFLKEPVDIQNIGNVVFRTPDISEQEKAPGIIGYIVKDEDKLWNLAKKYNTTVESIIKVNNLEKMELKAGEKLLIFKEKMSIL